jgi:hypothetical protein
MGSQGRATCVGPEHPGATEAHPRATEAHSGAIAHPRALEALPGTMEAHLGPIWRLTLALYVGSPWPYGGSPRCHELTWPYEGSPRSYGGSPGPVEVHSGAL